MNKTTLAKLQLHKNELSNKPTTSEKLFRQRLLGTRIPFFFQFVVPPYIVDFLIPSRMLVIEIDGLYHEKNTKYDEARTSYLKSWGFQIVRIPNDQVQKWPLKKIKKFPKLKGFTKIYPHVISIIEKDFELRGMNRPPTTGASDYHSRPQKEQIAKLVKEQKRDAFEWNRSCRRTC